MATYYVDRSHGSADDDNAGTSESLPWLTLHRAVDGISVREVGGSTGPGGIGGEGNPYTPVVAGDTVYVKSGTYTDNTAAADNDPVVKYNSTNAGTSGSPITFKAFPGHRPVVTRQLHSPADGDNQPVIGAYGANKNYITWSGFELGAGTDARLDGGSESRATTLTGCILEYLYIRKGSPSAWDGTGNWSGIYVQACDSCIVRHNDIGDVYYSDRAADNAAGVKAYAAEGLLIHNNTITNCNVGIGTKTSNRNTIVEYNFIYLTTLAGIRTGNVNAARTVYGNIYRYNVIVNVGERGIYYESNMDQVKNEYFYNNTVWCGTAATNHASVSSSTVGRIGIYLAQSPTLATSGDERPLWLYNNIFVRNSTNSSTVRGHQSHGVTDGIVANSLINYNLFWGTGGAHFACQENAGGTTTTALATWQALTDTPDLNSVAGSDPLFTVAGGGNVATNYKLQAGSPAVNAGRVGGVGGGAAVNIGAYATGNEVIGAGSTSTNWATCAGGMA